VFKNLINKGLPMSLLLIISAVVQGYAVKAFADEVAPPMIIEMRR
jgi:hypothetical protein